MPMRSMWPWPKPPGRQDCFIRPTGTRAKEEDPILLCAMAQFRFCQPNEMVEHGFVEWGAELAADADLILPTDRCGQRLEAGNADPHFCAGFVARRPGYPEPGPRQVPQHDFAPGFAAVTNLTLNDEAEAETVLTRNAGHCFYVQAHRLDNGGRTRPNLSRGGRSSKFTGAERNP